MTPYAVCLVTVPNRAQARRIARSLVQERLAACVNIVPGVESIYQWKGKMERSRELLLMIKTSRSKVKALVRHVKRVHSYSVPEVLSLNIVDGNLDYLKWIQDCVSGK